MCGLPRTGTFLVLLKTCNFIEIRSISWDSEHCNQQAWTVQEGHFKTKSANISREKQPICQIDFCFTRLPAHSPKLYETQALRRSCHSVERMQV